MQGPQPLRLNKAPSRPLTTSFSSSGPQLPRPRGSEQKARPPKARPSALFSRLTPPAPSQRQGPRRVPSGPPGRANFARAGSWPRAAGGAGPRRGVRPGRRLPPGPGGDPRRPGAPGWGCSGPRRGPARPARSRPLGPHPTPRSAPRETEVFGGGKHGFSPEPRLEKGLLSSFISRGKPPSTPPGTGAGGVNARFFSGWAGRGGQGAPRTKHSFHPLLLRTPRPGRPTAAVTSACSCGRLPTRMPCAPRARRRVSGGAGPGPRPARPGARPRARSEAGWQGWRLHFGERAFRGRRGGPGAWTLSPEGRASPPVCAPRTRAAARPGSAAWGCLCQNVRWGTPLLSGPEAVHTRNGPWRGLACVNQTAWGAGGCLLSRKTQLQAPPGASAFAGGGQRRGDRAAGSEKGVFAGGTTAPAFPRRPRWWGRMVGAVPTPRHKAPRAARCLSASGNGLCVFRPRLCPARHQLQGMRVHQRPPSPAPPPRPANPRGRL